MKIVSILPVFSGTADSFNITCVFCTDGSFNIIYVFCTADSFKWILESEAQEERCTEAMNELKKFGK